MNGGLEYGGRQGCGRPALTPAKSGKNRKLGEFSDFASGASRSCRVVAGWEAGDGGWWMVGAGQK